jgi:hypothetical protein
MEMIKKSLAYFICLMMITLYLGPAVSQSPQNCSDAIKAMQNAEERVAKANQMVEEAQKDREGLEKEVQKLERKAEMAKLQLKLAKDNYDTASKLFSISKAEYIIKEEFFKGCVISIVAIFTLAAISLGYAPISAAIESGKKAVLMALLKDAISTWATYEFLRDKLEKLFELSYDASIDMDKAYLDVQDKRKNLDSATKERDAKEKEKFNADSDLVSKRISLNIAIFLENNAKSELRAAQYDLEEAQSALDEACKGCTFDSSKPSGQPCQCVCCLQNAICELKCGMA